MKFVVSERAQRDMDQIFVAWAEFAGIEVADEILDALFGQFRLLASFPRIGRKSDEFRVGTRRFCSGKYVIYYLTAKSSVRILHVIHGARDQSEMY